MFRDLKEYQEIAKIYAEKVSKPEDLDENRNQMAMKLRQKREAKKITPTPQKGMGGGTGNPTNRRGIGAKPRKERKMSNIPVIDGPMNNPEYGKNMSRSKEDLNPPKDEKTTTMSTKDKFKSKFIKKDKGVGFVKRGTPGAQRAENKEKAKLRAQAMARANIEKKKAAMTKEDYTPYDIVLDYLLSSEQAATIEEANYIMTEMDAKTIQSIVAE